eukprot:gene17834-30797_t
MQRNTHRTRAPVTYQVTMMIPMSCITTSHTEEQKRAQAQAPTSPPPPPPAPSLPPLPSSSQTLALAPTPAQCQPSSQPWPPHETYPTKPLVANNCNAFADSGDMVVVMGAISSAVDARVRHANKMDIEDQVKAAEVSAQAVRDATARLKVRAEAAKLKAERMQQTAERIARDMRVVLAQTEDSRASTTSEATASRTAPLLPATSSSGSSALDTGAGIRTGAGTGAGASAIRNGSDRTVSKNISDGDGQDSKMTSKHHNSSTEQQHQ